MKTYQDELNEINIALEKGPPTREGAEMDAYRVLLRRKGAIERIMRSLEVGPFKPAVPKESKVTTPARPIHVVPVSMSTYQDLFIAPPFGHLGVLLLWTLEGMQIGDTIQFQQFSEKILEGVIVAIEPPGKKSIRPDVESNRYKVHWLPWDHTAMWGIINKGPNGKTKKAPDNR